MHAKYTATSESPGSVVCIVQAARFAYTTSSPCTIDAHTLFTLIKRLWPVIV